MNRQGGGPSAVRALALSAAALHVVLCGVAAFLMFFFATFPFENQSPEKAAADDWLIGAAPAIVVLAIAIGAAVITRRVAVAAVALAGQLAVGVVIFAYALRESDHSDGRLILYALAFAVTAVAATTAIRAERR